MNQPAAKSPPSPPESFSVRPYATGDETALAQLQRRTSSTEDGPPQDRERWLAKLGPESTELESVWVATDGAGGAIGQYSGIERRFHTPWGCLKVVVAVDALTAPAWRRRGVLTGLVTSAHRSWKKDGVSFVLGLPNEQWGSRTEALDWRFLFPLRWRVRALRPDALLRSKLGLPAMKGAAGAAMGRLFSGLWNGLWERRGRLSTSVAPGDPAALCLGDFVSDLRSEDRLLAHRDEKWIERRFSRWPSGPYRILLSQDREHRLSGYAAFRMATVGTGERVRRFGYLAELLAASGRTADALLRGVVNELRQQRAEAIWTLAPDRSPHAKDLWRHGFLPTRRSFGVHLVPLHQPPPLEGLRDPRRWTLHGGDFDVI